MRPIAVILVVVAVLAAGLTAILAKRWTDTQSAARAKETVQTAEVLVAARDIATGTVLADADLRYEPWPAAIAQRFASRKDGADPKAQALGTVIRRPLAEGEPFAAATPFARDGQGVLAALLAPGMRAVSVSITSASAVSGFIVPGDRVDVVLAADFQRADHEAAGKAGGPIVRYAAETILTDLKVLAVDQTFGKSKDGATIQGKTATLEVSPKQAEILITSGLMGQLSLVLRGGAKDQPAASASVPVPPFTADTEASRAMRTLAGGGPRPTGAAVGVTINRGGASSAKAGSP